VAVEGEVSGETVTHTAVLAGAVRIVTAIAVVAVADTATEVVTGVAATAVAASWPLVGNKTGFLRHRHRLLGCWVGEEERNYTATIAAGREGFLVVVEEKETMSQSE
jgi:hypothetical protein